MTNSGMNDPIIDSLKGQLFAMAAQLTDLTRTNPSLNYSDGRKYGLDLGNADEVRVAQLLEGGAVSIANLFPIQGTDNEGNLRDSLDLDDEVGLTVGGDPKALKAAKEQYKNAATLLEEKGVRSFYYACYAVRWTHQKKSYRAPLYIAEAQLEPAGSGGNYSVSIEVSDRPKINPSLETYLSVVFDLDLELLDDYDNLIPESISDCEVFAQELSKRIGAVVRLEEIEKLQILDNFNFTMLPMISDLKSQEFLELARSSAVIMAMLEFEHGPLLEQTTSLFSSDELDDEHPGLLPLVADANASQLVALKTALGGSHLVIQGPPGTGKSQTIANLVALLASEGKKILFVAEKQAAILAVSEILDIHGLGHLMLPLIGTGATRSAAVARIQQNLDRAVSIKPAEIDFERMERIHGTLSNRRALLNEKVEPSDCSVQQLIEFWSNTSSDAESQRLLEAADSRWLDAVPNQFHFVKDLAYRMSISGYLDAVAKKSSWATIDIPDELSSDVLENQLRSVSLDHLSDEAKNEVQPLLNLPLVETRELFHPLFLFASSELLISVDLADEDIFDYARAFNLGPVEGKLFNSRGNFFERIKSRREFKKLLVSSEVESREALRRLVQARITITEAGLVRPLRKLAPVVAEAGRWIDQLVVLFAELSDDESMSLSKANEAIDGMVRDLDGLSKAKEWSRIRRTLNSLEISDQALNIFSQGFSQEKTEDLLVGILAGRLVRRHLREGSDLGVIDPKELTREFVSEDRTIFAKGGQRVAFKSAQWTKAWRDENEDFDRKLRDQLARRRKGMTIRNLFHEVPEAMLAINPCVAMSPLQVSSFLPRKELFDVVIFDEASQVTPIEAIPALARGKRVVVAGDKHQLPPSDFWETQNDGDSLALADVESVLKKLEVLLPNQWLNVHYRSNDDRLIAVSAEHVYWALSRLRLVTVPSATREEDCLQFIEVPNDPLTMRGTRTSGDDEIEVVVQEVFRHAEEKPDRSLGVITLSLEHCNRVLNALERARRTRRDLDSFFSKEGKQRFFVKNIERVQGDERDVIIISTGYQKNAADKLPQTFGPISKKEGGYRRVNVMISRAKHAMTLISGFNSGDIRVQETSYGVQLMHTFFQFMETGGQLLANATTEEIPMNPFELSIFEEMTRRGIEVVPQLGASGYWIDFALVHPEKPGAYVLAVEADGARYHSTPTARERDRLRQEHLEAKGFSFHRVWSTDWFKNRSRETDRIVEAYEDAVRKFGTQETGKIKQIQVGGIEITGSRELFPTIPSAYAGSSIEQIPDSVGIGIMRDAKERNPSRSKLEIVEIIFQALGYRRHGPRIMRRLSEWFDAC